jgi:hypothetical protein
MAPQTLLRTLFEVCLLAGIVSSVVIGFSLRRMGTFERSVLHQWTWSDLQAYRRSRVDAGAPLFWYNLFVVSLVACCGVLGLLLMPRGCYHP